MSNRKQNRKKQPKGIKHKFESNQPRMALYNPLTSMPDEFDTKIRSYANILPTGATQGILSTIFTNSVLHSTDDMASTIGQNLSLSNMARNYAKYRVVSYRLDYVLLPRSATIDSCVAVVHAPDDRSLQYTTSAWTPVAPTQDKSKLHIVPRNTTSPCVVQSAGGYSIMSVVGNPEYQQDAEYSGTVSSGGVFTAPSNVTYAYFYAGNVASVAFAASTSPSIHLTLTQYVRFYDKRY